MKRIKRLDQMEDRELADLIKRTLYGYAFFVGLCLAFLLFLACSYAALRDVQQSYQQSQIQEALHDLQTH